MRWCFSQRLDLMILESFSRLSDSMILSIQPKMQTQVRARLPSSSSLCCEESFQWLHLGSATPEEDGIRVHKNILILIVLKLGHNCRKTSTNSSSGSKKVVGLCTFGFWDARPPPSQVGFAVLKSRKLSFQFTGGNWGFGGWEAQLSFHGSDLLVWRLRSSSVPHRRRKNEPPRDVLN